MTIVRSSPGVGLLDQCSAPPVVIVHVHHFVKLLLLNEKNEQKNINDEAQRKNLKYQTLATRAREARKREK
jgi:hypothetical protein